MSIPSGDRPESVAGDGTDDDAERPPSTQGPPVIDRALRRRLDEVFGEVLPRVTSDERDPGERPGMDAEFYRSNRPPHHDR